MASKKVLSSTVLLSSCKHELSLANRFISNVTFLFYCCLQPFLALALPVSPIFSWRARSTTASVLSFLLLDLIWSRTQPVSLSSNSLYPHSSPSAPYFEKNQSMREPNGEDERPESSTWNYMLPRWLPLKCLVVSPVIPRNLLGDSSMRRLILSAGMLLPIRANLPQHFTSSKAE